ncbi:MAG: phosphatase PAP2 family protein [Polyangiales bacterium]
MKRALVAMSMLALSAVARADDAETAPPTAPPAKAGAQPLATDLPTRFSGKKLVWDPAYTYVSTSQYVILGVAAAVALGSNSVTPRATNWASTTTLDDKVRNTLRYQTYTGRARARDASDVLLGVMSAFPFIVDSLIVAYWYRGSADVARQMFLIDAEAMAISAAIQGTVTWAAGRERPFVRDCGGQIPSDTTDCTSSNNHRSFFSGHTSQAFTSAALICAHHLALDLFDSSADAITCGLAMTAAAATGTLRMMADAHYITDVLVGATVGTLVGFGVPWVHHYRRKGQAAAAAIDVRIVHTFGGLAAVGGF